MPDLAGTRILFVNNYSGASIGGGEVQLLQLIDACVEAGVQVEVACAAGSGLAVQARERGVVVHELDFAPQRLARAVGELRALVFSRQIEIVQGTGYLTNLLTRRAVKGLDVKLVNAVHVEPRASVANGGSKATAMARMLADWASAGRVDRFVAVSQAVADAVAAQLKLDPSAVTVIRNGVDAEAVRSAAMGVIGGKLPCGDGPLVGTVGRLEPVKGTGDFVRAAAPVLDRMPDARFAIAGSGTNESRLYTVAAAVDVSHRLQILGHVSAVARFIDALDVFVMPSLSEGLGIAALEAMALGKPVVATDVGGLPEVVVDGETGLLVPAGEPTSLARAIVQLLEDPERARAMGAAGRERVEREFTLTRMGREWLAVYEELIGG